MRTLKLQIYMAHRVASWLFSNLYASILPMHDGLSIGGDIYLDLDFLRVIFHVFNAAIIQDATRCQRRVWEVPAILLAAPSCACASLVEVFKGECCPLSYEVPYLLFFVVPLLILDF